MKKFAIAIILFILSNTLAFSQNNYFRGVGKENNIICLYANIAEYSKLSYSFKVKIIGEELQKSKCASLMVLNGYKREIWVLNKKSGRVTLIEECDMNNNELSLYMPKTLNTSPYRPWFVYVGGNVSSQDDYTYYGGSVRVGCYLYKNYLDAAFQFDINGNDDGFALYPSLNTRVYCPIKKLNCAPFIGTGVTMIYDNKSKDTDVTIPVYLGLNLIRPKGVICIEAHYAKDFFCSIGYTFNLK